MKRFSILLFALLVTLSLVLPVSAVAGDVRVTYMQTDAGAAVRAQLTDPPADDAAAYTAFLGLFSAGGIASITDSNGYAWYPVPFADAPYTVTNELNNSYTTGTYSFDVSDPYLLKFDSFLTPTSSSYNGRNISTSILFRPSSVSTFTFPKSSNYSVFLAGDWSIPAGSMVSALYFEGVSFWEFNQLVSIGSKTVGTSFIPAQQILNIFNPPTYPDGARQFCNLRMYLVDRGASSGSGFAGFGGGQTRGGGAGRKLNLIPSSKADSVAVGSGVSRADVLAAHALFDEGTKVVSIPNADGTTTTRTAESWVYNYDNRTYTITTTDGTPVRLVYGDDKVTVTDGTNPAVDYYYVAPDTTGGGGDTPGGDDTNDSWWSKLLRKIFSPIFDFFDAIGDLLGSIVDSVIGIFTKLLDALTSLVAFIGRFGLIIGSFYAFLPPEVQGVITAALIIAIAFSVFSLFKR